MKLEFAAWVEARQTREKAKKYVKVNKHKEKEESVAYDPELEFGADLTEPHDWYTTARQMKRKIVLHVGPTNSGKTYNALERLKSAASGVYCGPLRLLAWEVHEKLTSGGVPCNLVTGQELEMVPGARHVACTVEMADTNNEVEVAVIDENQMIGSIDRGSSWTRAVLGIPAEELHVCGSDNMVELVAEICAITGDEYEVNRYKRLTPLSSGKPLSSWVDVRPGDCIITFSRKDLYTLKRYVESKTGQKCCMIYGSLPPELRKQQATLFNEPGNGYDILLASDAIGMGLNLNIARVVFATLEKFDGVSRRVLTPDEALQIGGRAGRKGTQHEGGVYTTLFPRDLLILKKLMKKKTSLVTRAGLAPTLEQLELISTQRPDMNMVQLLEYFQKFASTDDLYFMCNIEGQIEIAKALRSIPLRLQDRYTFTLAPASRGEGLVALKGYAKQYTEDGEVRVHGKVTKVTPKNPRQIASVEDKYNQYDLYCWLANRFPEHMFPDVENAVELRQRCLGLIEGGLATSSMSAHQMWEERAAEAEQTTSDDDY